MRVDSLLEPKVVIQGTAGFGTSTLASFFSSRGFCLVLIKPASFDTGDDKCCTELVAATRLLLTQAATRQTPGWSLSQQKLQPQEGLF